MPAILIRTSLGALLLLVMPLIVLLSGWHWRPQPMGAEYVILYGFTETVTRPWGIITSLLFAAWFLWCLRPRLKPALLIILLAGGAILLGQYAKSLLKEQVQEARPYVMWLDSEGRLDPRQFYQLPRAQRSQQVRQMVAGYSEIPQWLKKHWAFETGFSFPSGHTMFAASWALLGAGLLWPRRRYLTVVALMVWAGTVMASRLMLGMHWPQDLIVSTLISWLIVTLACWLVLRSRPDVFAPKNK